MCGDWKDQCTICNVNFTYHFDIVFYIWHYAFEKKNNRIFWAFCDLGYT